MAKIKKTLEKVNGSVLLRNLILAFCAVVVFLFLVNISLNVFTRHNRHKVVPDFSNMSITDARRLAKEKNLRIEVNDSLYVPAFQGGIVLTQLPEPGTEVKSGRRIFVTVNSYRQRMVQVPYVTGVSLRQAKNNLEIAGLEIAKLTYKEDIATNYVLETRYDGKLIGPSSKVEAEQGSGVNLVVGMRSQDSHASVPKIVGFPLQEAKSRLWESGMNVGEILMDEDITIFNRSEARVYTQNPEQGTRLPLGSTVSLRLTLSERKIEEGSSSSDRAAQRIISSQQRRSEAVDENER